jgi:hypothetical protein
MKKFFPKPIDLAGFILIALLFGGLYLLADKPACAQSGGCSCQRADGSTCWSEFLDCSGCECAL